MKPLDAMNREERTAFLVLSLDVLQQVLMNPGLPSNVKPALMALWIKGDDRPTLNVKTEYEIDKGAFVRDCAREGVVFLDNLRATIEEIRRKGESPFPVEMIDQILNRGAFERLRGVLFDDGYQSMILHICEHILVEALP